MRVRQPQRVIEDIALEENRGPPLQREFPQFHIPVVTLHHEGIQKHDEEGADRRDEDDKQRRRAQEPA